MLVDYKSSLPEQLFLIDGPNTLISEAEILLMIIVSRRMSGTARLNLAQITLFVTVFHSFLIYVYGSDAQLLFKVLHDAKGTELCREGPQLRDDFLAKSATQCAMVCTASQLCGAFNYRNDLRICNLFPAGDDTGMFTSVEHCRYFTVEVYLF